MPEVGGNKTADKSGSSKGLVEARDTFQTLFEMSRLLNTGLDMETLAICVRLCEQVRLELGVQQSVLCFIVGSKSRGSGHHHQGTEKGE